jgi:hypothetical protein
MPKFGCRSLRHALLCPTEATVTNITHGGVVRYGTQVPTRQYVLTPSCLVNAYQNMEAIWTDDLDLSYPQFHLIGPKYEVPNLDLSTKQSRSSDDPQSSRAAPGGVSHYASAVTWNQQYFR